MGSYKGMAEYTGDSVSAAVISAPSIYCFGVLLAFFGGNALQNSYDYLTAWKDDSVKIPMPFKLYPKTAVLLIMISMYLSVFSSADDAQLINDNFKIIFIFFVSRNVLSFKDIFSIIIHLRLIRYEFYKQ